MTNVLSLMPKDENSNSGMSKSFDAECRNCSPITPLQCINHCRVYKLKSELRKLRGAMDNPNYMNELFNVLKNDTRFLILQAIVNGRYSLSQLQQLLKKSGHKHSQDTLTKEYLRPLMAVGLANEARDEYYATTFGNHINKLMGNFPELTKKMPGHSECHEETLIQSLSSGTKTFEEIETLVSPKIISRILKRLRSAGLIETPIERDYVFFFRSKRDSSKDSFTATERRIYETIAVEGTPAGKLAKKTGLSMRRTYKILRGLKGKKLVFARTIPKTYGLTSKGKELATVLQGLQQIVEETWNSSGKVMRDAALTFELAGSSDYSTIKTFKISEQKEIGPKKSVGVASRIEREKPVTIRHSSRPDSVPEIVSGLLSHVEESRQRELAKAFEMMGRLNKRQRKIVSNLTSILLKQTFLPVVENFRRAAATNGKELVEVASKLLEIK